eukprot:1386302-Alexandrium_andersonii.AAC.1
MSCNALADAHVASVWRQRAPRWSRRLAVTSRAARPCMECVAQAVSAGVHEESAQAQGIRARATGAATSPSAARSSESSRPQSTSGFLSRTFPRP